jgi:hypothetical protein
MNELRENFSRLSDLLNSLKEYGIIVNASELNFDGSAENLKELSKEAYSVSDIFKAISNTLSYMADDLADFEQY